MNKLKNEEEKLPMKDGQVVVGVYVVGMGANGVVETLLGFDEDAVVVIVAGPGQQHRAQIIHSTGVIRPQSPRRKEERLYRQYFAANLNKRAVCK